MKTERVPLPIGGQPIEMAIAQQRKADMRRGRESQLRDLREQVERLTARVKALEQRPAVVYVPMPASPHIPSWPPPPVMCSGSTGGWI